MNVEAILFDLDGTLIDTAPDLVAVLNALLSEEGRAPMPYALARNEVSNGAIGLLRLGFGQALEANRQTALRQRFLEKYQENICHFSLFFNGLLNYIEFLSNKKIPWGIVTNKPQAMAEALLHALKVANLPGTLVGGDRLEQRKPDPAPLHLAASELRVDPADCVYIGDAPGDIEAGHAAGMLTIAAGYGYIRQYESPANWKADALLPHSSALPRLLRDWGIMPA